MLRYVYKKKNPFRGIIFRGNSTDREKIKGLYY